MNASLSVSTSDSSDDSALRSTREALQFEADELVKADTNSNKQMTVLDEAMAQREAEFSLRSIALHEHTYDLEILQEQHLQTFIESKNRSAALTNLSKELLKEVKQVNNSSSEQKIRLEGLRADVLEQRDQSQDQLHASLDQVENLEAQIANMKAKVDQLETERSTDRRNHVIEYKKMMHAHVVDLDRRNYEVTKCAEKLAELAVGSSRLE